MEEEGWDLWGKTKLWGGREWNEETDQRRGG